MKYFIKTFGCQMNKSDSERITGFLEKKGYKSAPNMKGADLIVINACSVRQTAIDRIFGLLNNIKKLKKKNPKLKIIITGCVLKSDKRKFEEFLALHRTFSGAGFDEVLTTKEFLGNNYLSILCSSIFVPIMTGCDNFCSYCVVPYARGREISRPMEEVTKEVKNLIKKGYKEIILLGQNVNSYKYGFAKLLKKLNTLPGKFKIYFLTNHPKDVSDELINTIAKSKKVAKEIHLPVQSGDDEILRKMNRGYTVKQYKNLVKKIHRKIPNVKISTDAIVGFPKETKKQFENTIKLFKQIKFDKAYINKYSLRADTAAANLKDNVSWQEKKRRWKILNDIISNKPKLIVILGPTASGKSDLAVKVAKDFNGEIISADSRQVYKEMDIGTGKITQKEMKAIPHHCLDLRSPKSQITVAEYRKKALEAIKQIQKKNKIPILCGGTGFYIQAVIEGSIPEVKPDLKLRKKLEKKTPEQLFKQLKKLDPRRAKEIDSKNRRRLVRALEIVIKSGKPVPPLQFSAQGGPASGWRVLYLGIKKALPELKKSIDKRVDKMVKQGLKEEVETLIRKYGRTTILRNAIGYSEWLNYMKNPPQATHAGGPVKMRKALLSGKLKKQIAGTIKLHSFQFAKRQITWFKRNKQIVWVENYQQAKTLLFSFFF